jgi:O-antigen ligase
LLVLQAGATTVVLAALPYQLFQLDRYTFIKELVLLMAGTTAALLCLAGAKRLTIFLVDALLAGYLGLSLVSALAASNGWLAARAVGVSLAGAALFWSARAVARTGRAGPLLAALAAAVVVGAVTGLIQAYGLIDSSLASLTRAPGGTFGNRNFMAHMVAIGMPVLLLVSLEARRKRDSVFGTIGIVLASAALVLSRSRAAWLGAAASTLFLMVEGLWVGRLWDDQQLRRRVLRLGGLAVAGLLLALVLPNRLNWRSDSPYFDSLTGVANYKEGSGKGRLIQYGNTLGMAADHPLLGVGPGNWPVYYPRYMVPAADFGSVFEFSALLSRTTLASKPSCVQFKPPGIPGVGRAICRSMSIMGRETVPAGGHLPSPDSSCMPSCRITGAALSTGTNKRV